ncbi:hypothetical protein DFJ74DRAFT_676003 [Hyaloraphidium curvatum]|nr:hypothetical protein DFJ74DRAFT_676003 [Hyaloraphidium curvatum]
MDALAAENAQLREDNASLRDEVAALRAQLAALGAGNAKGTSTGSSADDSVPFLPSEIVLKIASYFPPGSRTLLYMMLTCKSFYELVLPRFLEEFTVSQAFNTERALKRFLGKRAAKDKLMVVKKLDITDAGVSFQLIEPLVLACKRLEELSFAPDYPYEIASVLLSPSLANLNRLELQYNNGQYRDPIRLPQLKHLDYTGTVVTELFEAFLAGCPMLETIDCEIKDLPVDAEHFPEPFVAKIRTWRYGNEMGISPMLTFESFRPLAIERADVDEWSEIGDEEDWKDLLRLPATQKIDLRAFTPSSFLLGLPPALRTLSILSMRLEGLPPSDLARIGDVLRRSSAEFIFYPFVDEFLDPWRDEHELREFTSEVRDELAFWLSLGQSLGRLKLGWYPWGNWMRKTFPELDVDASSV